MMISISTVSWSMSLFLLAMLLWGDSLALEIKVDKSNDMTLRDGIFDPVKNNRGGGWAEQRGITTLYDPTLAAELRAHFSKHTDAAWSQLQVLVWCPAMNVKSGGIKVLHKLVHDLNTHGATASIVYPKHNFRRLDWIDEEWNVPAIAMEAWDDITMGNSTILILPESQPWEAFYGLYPRAKQSGAIFGRIALNYAGLYPANGPGRDYVSDSTDFIICDNDFTADVISRKMGVNTVQIQTFVNPRLYYEESPSTRASCDRLVVAYVSRKSNSGIITHQVLESKFPQVEWIVLANLSEEEYAQSLRRAHVYIATGKLEGLNLSILEAWASGALVVGFHGHGASLMMVGGGEKQNAIVVPNGDDSALVSAVYKVLQSLMKDCNHYRHVVDNAHERLKEYSAESEDAAAQFNTDLLMAYRFGFPFPSEHMWATNDNSNNIICKAPE